VDSIFSEHWLPFNFCFSSDNGKVWLAKRFQHGEQLCLFLESFHESFIFFQPKEFTIQIGNIEVDAQISPCVRSDSRELQDINILGMDVLMANGDGWIQELHESLNRHLARGVNHRLPDSMPIRDYLKSVLPELSDHRMKPELDLLDKHKIRTIGAVRFARESFLVNLGLSEPVLGALLKMK
jgi:hypothetical protein